MKLNIGQSNGKQRFFRTGVTIPHLLAISRKNRKTNPFFFTKKKKWHAGRVRGKTFTGGNGAAKAYLDDFFAAGFFAGAFFAGDCFAAGFFAGAFFGAERFRASSWSQGDGAAESGSGSAGREAQAQEP